MPHQDDLAEFVRWLGKTDQFAYGKTKDSYPKQLRSNRLGEHFILVNGVLKKVTRDASLAVDYYNRL